MVRGSFLMEKWASQSTCSQPIEMACNETEQVCPWDNHPPRASSASSNSASSRAAAKDGFSTHSHGLPPLQTRGFLPSRASPSFTPATEKPSEFVSNADLAGVGSEADIPIMEKPPAPPQRQLPVVPTKPRNKQRRNSSRESYVQMKNSCRNNISMIAEVEEGQVEDNPERDRKLRT